LETVNWPFSEVAPDLETTVSPGPATALDEAIAWVRCLLGRAAWALLASSRAATHTKKTVEVLMMTTELVW
jgi:hypothetical protein